MGPGRGRRDQREVLVGRARVAHLEADRTADLDDVAGGERADLRIGADHSADQEVAAFVLVGVLVHGDADQQPALDQLPVLFRQVGDDLLQFGQRGRAGQLVQDVLLGPGDHHGRADGPGALAHHGRGHHRPAEAALRRRPESTISPSAKSRVVPRPPCPVTSPPTSGRPGQHLAGSLDERVDGKAVRVGQQHGHHVVVSGLRHADDREARRASGSAPGNFSVSSRNGSTRASGSLAAQALTALEPSTPWLPPMTPGAPQPMTLGVPAISIARRAAGSTASGSGARHEDEAPGPEDRRAARPPALTAELRRLDQIRPDGQAITEARHRVRLPSTASPVITVYHSATDDATWARSAGEGGDRRRRSVTGTVPLRRTTRPSSDAEPKIPA